jgi:hypothetical protein
MEVNSKLHYPASFTVRIAALCRRLGPPPFTRGSQKIRFPILFPPNNFGFLLFIKNKNKFG